MTGDAHGPAEPRYDLHVHTSNSDGLWSPNLVLERAGHLAGLSITDHSGFTYSEELVREAARHGTALLFPGIEISTTHDGCKYHVLGFGRALLDPDFQEYAFHPTRVKNEVYTTILDELRREGYELPSFADILAGRGLPGVAHSTKWMMSKTLIAAYLALDGLSEERSRPLLAEKYEVHKSRQPDRYLPTRTTIERVRELGGLPVIAHAWWECPSGRNTMSNVGATLQDFRRWGLVGLEVSTRHQTVGTEEFRRQVAADLDLLPFAGSDFHANGKTSLGQFGLTASELARVHETAAALDLKL